MYRILGVGKSTFFVPSTSCGDDFLLILTAWVAGIFQTLMHLTLQALAGQGRFHVLDRGQECRGISQHRHVQLQSLALETASSTGVRGAPLINNPWRQCESRALVEY